MKPEHPRTSCEFSGITRRSFLKYSTIIAISVSCEGLAAATGAAGVGASKGYLLVDSKKCQGCLSCMLACALVHEGEENLSLARIQVVQNPFEKYPADVHLNQCRQCVKPACLEVCPTGALHADAGNGNVRLVDQNKCIGCKACVHACPYQPGRSIWNFTAGRAQKCDLCVNTPYWNETGGPGGRQACVAVCPIGAIIFSSSIPWQKGDAGYDVNLRGLSWKKLGYPID